MPGVQKHEPDFRQRIKKHEHAGTDPLCVMQPTTLKRLEHIIKSTGDSISPTVLKDYLDYMEDAYLIFSIPNLVSPLTEQQTIVKRYFADNGILNHVSCNVLCI